MIKSALNYLWRVWLWSSEAELAYLTVVVVALACAGALCFCTEPAFRYAGLVLQLLGLCTVAFGIRKTRDLFEQPHLEQRFWAWLARWPRWRLPTSTGMASGTVPAPKGMAWGNLWAAVPEDASLELRVKALEANLDAVNQRLGRQENELRSGLGEAAERFKAEAEARAKRDTEIETLIRTAQTGGLDISFMGLVWLFVGLAITTGSLELAWLFGSSTYDPHTDFVKLVGFSLV